MFSYGGYGQGIGGASYNVSGSASGQGQGSSANGGGSGSGGHHSHHASSSSASHHGHGGSNPNDDLKRQSSSFQFYGSSSNSGGGVQGSGGQDASNSSFVAPLPEHVEAEIMSGSSNWLLHPGGLPLGLDLNSSLSTGSGTTTQATSTNPPTMPPNDRRISNQSNGPSNANSSPSAPTNTVVHQAPSTQSNVSGSNNIAPSPISSDPTLPSPSAQFGVPNVTAAPAPIPVVPPMAPPTDPLLLGFAQDGWRLAVEPLTFTSGLEGISGLPLDMFHAATAFNEVPPAPIAIDNRRPGDNLTHQEEVQRVSTSWPSSANIQLDSYLADLIDLMEPFAPSASNPNPNPPPPFLHTRITRLATLVRESLKLLEPRSQQHLDADFTLPPPGIEISEADREMAAIRLRREVLTNKQNKRESAGGAAPRRPGAPGLNVGPTAAPPQFTSADAARRMGGLAPRPPRDVWRCSGCGATQSNEWRDGPDGPQSLCENCGVSCALLRVALRPHLAGLS